MKTRTTPPQIEKIFRALSDRTRLRILNLLRDGEVCVCHLVAVLDSPQPTVSRHLAVVYALASAAWASDRFPAA